MDIKQLRLDVENGDIHKEHIEFVLNTFDELRTLLVRIKDIASNPHDYMVDKIKILANRGIDILEE